MELEKKNKESESSRHECQEDQDKAKQVEFLNKEEYITINLVLFREYTSLLRTKSNFQRDDPPEWKEYIETQITDLVNIQDKIHKIIMSMSAKQENEQ